VNSVISSSTALALLAIQGAQTRSIHKGDIIAFKQPDGNVTIVHRVVASRENSNATVEFKTKGDANNGEDPLWVPQGNVLGIVIFRIPYVGFLILNPTLTLGLAVSIFIVLLVWPGRTKSIKASRIRHRRRSDYQ
jgi:signal peptidase